MDANPRSKIEGLNQLPGHSNYFIGGNAAKWFANIPNYSKVQYREIYRGIDLVYYGNQRQLENDFIVAPAADPRTINLSFAGAKSISIDQGGALLLKTAGGQVQLQKPVAYQDVDGSRHEVPVKYELRDPARSVVGFDVADYDRSRPLIIDPVFIYSTFLGGLSSDIGSDITLDSSGNAYVAGYTGSANFPTLNSVQGFQPTRSAFVTKINATGTALVYSTYLGGSNSGGRQYAWGIALDAANNAYVTGLTVSSDFPTTANGFQQTKPTGATADAGFVTKLNPSGTLTYSTYLGAVQGTQAFAIATDGAGNAYVTGTTGVGFPLTASAFSSSPATTGFLTKLNTNASGASSLVYSTFLGTLGTTFPRGITVDAAGNAYVTGTALSTATGFASAGAFQTTYGGGFSDVFVAKFNTNASGAASRVYSTYVGGSGDDSVGTSAGLSTSGSRAIAIDAAGNAYITGRTTSTNYPMANAFQLNKAGTSTNAFLTKLNSTGSGLVYSTYFGGNTTVGDEGTSVAVNVVGNAYITGLSNSSDFPTANPITPIQSTGRIFLAKFTPEGNALVYSTRLGTNQGEFGLGVALDGAGNAFITGTAFSGLPTTAGAFQTTNAGIGDAFISQVADPTIIGRVVDEDNNPIPSATVNLTGVPSATTTTDANGYFTFGLLTVGNNYTVTVSVPTYVFTSQVVNNLQKNVRLNFNPVVVSISGRVTATGTSTGVSGVTMSLTGGKILSAQTNGSGSYSFGNLPAGRSYTVTPSKTGLTFVPTSTTFDSISTNQTANFLAPPIFEPVVLTAAQVEIKTWTFEGRTYAYLKLSFPNAGYRVVSFGQAARAGNDFTGDASVEKFSGPSVQAVTTTAGIYDLGILSPGSYNFIFKNSGTVVKTQAFTVAAPPFPANPIDNAREFVRQQYRDFLNREADPAGEDFWTDNITKCSDPARRPAGQTEAQCTLRQRETTSGAFFQSPEFQYTGYFVYRMYQGALGRQPKLSEFTPDAQFVGNGIIVNGQLSAAKINENKAAFAASPTGVRGPPSTARWWCAKARAVAIPTSRCEDCWRGRAPRSMCARSLRSTRTMCAARMARQPESS
ncbi:MAG: SBBP repeat-containing protein, partial [Nitrospirota bacterium]